MSRGAARLKISVHEVRGLVDYELRHFVAAQVPDDAQKPGICVWKVTERFTGNWLMRGQFLVVYPTGPSIEGSAESEPSHFFPAHNCSPVSSPHDQRFLPHGPFVSAKLLP